MAATPNTNPYESPHTQDATSARKAKRHRYVSFIVLSSVFLLLNFAVLAFSQWYAADFLEEFGIELPVLSTFAYSVASKWIGLTSALLIFSTGTTIIYAKLKTNASRFSSYFFMAAMVIWLLFTLGFAFGILCPLFYLYYELAA